MTKAVVLIDLENLGGVISVLSISICHIIPCLNPCHTGYFLLNLSSIFYYFIIKTRYIPCLSAIISLLKNFKANIFQPAFKFWYN